MAPPKKKRRRLGQDEITCQNIVGIRGLDSGRWSLIIDSRLWAGPESSFLQVHWSSLTSTLVLKVWRSWHCLHCLNYRKIPHLRAGADPLSGWAGKRKAAAHEGSEMGWKSGSHSPTMAAVTQADFSVSQITVKEGGKEERHGQGLQSSCPFAFRMFSMKAGVRAGWAWPG